jgi:prepilin-type N-terminal cleavage/methylation domain-containing protein
VPASARDRKTAGFTLVEMVVVIALISLLSAFLTVIINPVQMRRKVRDVARLVDLGNLLQAVEGYVADYGYPPDEENVLRMSDQPVVAGVAPQLSDGRGWLGEDLSSSLAKLPTDPLNISPFVYSYKRVERKFELDAVLEEYAEMMSDDSGNDSGRYELGTDLTII